MANYDLNGEKVLIVINVRKYPVNRIPQMKNRDGSENDYKLVKDTFEERVAPDFPNYTVSVNSGKNGFLHYSALFERSLVIKQRYQKTEKSMLLMSMKQSQNLLTMLMIKLSLLLLF